MTDSFPLAGAIRLCDAIARRSTTIILACLLLCGCQRGPDHGASAGHRKMLNILEKIAHNPPDDHPVIGSGRARRLQSELASQQKMAEVNGRSSDNFEVWKVRFNLGQAELNLGNVAVGIDHLSKAHELLSQVKFPQNNSPQSDATFQTYWKNKTRLALGVAYMRLGEDQNCCLHHTAESCILPIRGAGIHSRQEGSRNAIKVFTEVLDSPSTLVKQHIELQQSARWLLNIAYMTIDGYPDDVPEQYLIPSEVFQSDVDFPRFENVAPKLGLNTFNLCGGAIVDDFDNDGYLDIVTSTMDLNGQMRLFRNNQDGTFSDRTEQAGLVGLFGGLNMVQADYDNDGNTDILVLRGAWLRKDGLHPNSLLQNNGNATFTDVTFDAGLGECHFPTKTAAWADYDNDGDLDLFIGNESSADVAAPCQLFRNNGDRTFTDVALSAGVQIKTFAMGCVWGDFNADRFPDLYVAGTWPNRLYHNNRDGTFTDVASTVKAPGPNPTFPVWFWDFDNDGILDLYASCSTGSIGNLAANLIGDSRLQDLEPPANDSSMCLYRGDGRGSFEEVAKQRNLTYPAQPMGANFGDLNNDGYLDFYLATGDVDYSELRPNVMFLNQRGESFANVTMAGGFGHLQKGHGVSFADLDNDGDQDIYVQMGGAYPGDKFNDALFQNPGFGNHWITIKLEGRKSNRSAIGARIHARIDEGGKQRSVFRDVNSGGSFGCNPLQQTVGLGQAERILRLEIFWPASRSVQAFEDVDADQIIQIIEGEDHYTKLSLKVLKIRDVEDSK